MPPKQPNNNPNQFEQLFIEIDGTFKRGGLPINRFKVKDSVDISERELDAQQGLKTKLTKVISGAANTYFARLNDYGVTVYDVTISRGIQLPNANTAGIGKLFVIKDMSGSATSTTITIAAIDGEAIDGEPTQSITSNWGVKRVESDGSNWYTW